MSKQLLTVITFFILAFALTFFCSQLPSWVVLSVDIKDILCGFGPLISGLICYKLFKLKSSYSIGGNQPEKAWAVTLISIITFLITYKGKNFGTTVFFTLMQVVYCFGEEFGWRHYLQTATNLTKKWLQPLIIGIVWFSWHFSWLHEPLKAMTGQQMNAPLPAVIISAVLALSIISYLLGLIMIKTEAIILPTILHFAVKTTVPAIAVTVIITVIAMLTWDKFSLRKIKNLSVTT